MNKMDLLPTELIYNILLHVEPESIMTVVNTSKLFNAMGEIFWQEKFIHDYGHYDNVNQSWRHLYIAVLTGILKSIDLYYQNEFIETIWTTKEQLTSKLNSIN